MEKEQKNKTESMEELKKENNLKEDLKDLLKNDELETLKEKNISLLAEMENLRKRHANEKIDASKYFLSSFLQDFIPSLEMFESALKAKNVSDEIKNWLIGFEMIFKNMMSSLEGQGVSKIETKIGDEFDSNIHEALDENYSEEVAKGNILEVKQNGYKLNSRLIKPVAVIVSKGKE